MKRPRSRTLPLTGAVLAGLLLQACAQPPPPVNCPRVRVLQEPGSITRFKEGEGRDITDVLFQAEFAEVTGGCLIEANSIELDFTVEILATRGPADTEKAASMSIFMAVQAPDRTFLQRNTFDIDIVFPGNRSRVSYIDEYAGLIPKTAEQEPDTFTIYVGFELTEEELQFNREQLEQDPQQQ